MKAFLKNIDFSLLKKQKQTVIKLSEKKSISATEKAHLEGILSLIDEIQDTAVDKHGYKESEVFKISRK